MAELPKALMWLSLITWLSLGWTALSLNSLPSVAFQEPLVPASGRGPEVLQQFTSHILLEGIGPYTFPTAHGVLAYDAHKTLYSIRAHFEFPAFDHAKMRMQRIGTADSDTVKLQEVCLNWTFPGTGFDSLIAQFVNASFTGRSQVHGKPCDVWTLPIKTVGGKVINVTLCVDGKLPLQLNRTDEIITFLNFTETIDPEMFVIPEACMHEPKPCGDGSIVNQTIYIAHTRKNYNISSQNVADAKGDAVFLCQDRFMWKAAGYELLSSYEISMVRNISQYTNYLPPGGGKGLGGDGFHVGRECPLSVGEQWGQCEEDAHWFGRIGQWFSLPRGGQCLSPQQTIGKDCTWQIEQRIATIGLDCLYDQHSFGTLCENSSAPFAVQESTLKRSLETEDISKGGCPRVRTSECALHPSCRLEAGDCCPNKEGAMLDCCNSSGLTTDL